MNENINTNDYIMIPNIAVQNIVNGDIKSNSYIQLFGKKTIAYIRSLLELKNRKCNINFTINNILQMLEIKNNLARERKYLKDFLKLLKKSKLIDFIGEDIDLDTISIDYMITAKLNIYEYNEKNEVQNYFQLKDSEFDLLNKYSGDLDKYNLLNLFCNLKSRMKRNSNDCPISSRFPEVAYPSYELIKEDIFIESDRTLKQYIDCLVNLDLIRYDYAGDMIFKMEGQVPIRKKSNFTYTLFRPGWEIELANSISDYKSKKKKDGWSFLTVDKEKSADEKRSISQKINMLQKLKDNGQITQSQNKELSKLLRQKEKWQFDADVDVKKIEEEKLIKNNPDKTLSDIYWDMGYEKKSDRAYEEENNLSPKLPKQETVKVITPKKSCLVAHHSNKPLPDSIQLADRLSKNQDEVLVDELFDFEEETIDSENRTFEDDSEDYLNEISEEDECADMIMDEFFIPADVPKRFIKEAIEDSKINGVFNVPKFRIELVKLGCKLKKNAS